MDAIFRPTVVRRAAILAAVVAVLAGIFGMHVLAAPLGAAAGHGTEPHAAASHHSPQHGPAAAPETPDPPSCACGAGCGDHHSAHAACTPAPSATSLSAPPPGSAQLSAPRPSAPGTARDSGYSYLPATPTPGELSISRT
ncbi:DUF6153 family protein [Arthrobacter sp. Soil763]|uniref:DUF6153 family protein n=1 Tax=Arthrobacter sp. Soil763 TaxID=1736402 RepID=UPI000AA52C32|nr:DUF6153 family protein [Arthrobacter sp. Soil763]